MQLPLLDSFTFSDATCTLLGDVVELARRVNEFRPMSSEVVEAVRKRLLPERVYSSNAIEGNTLSLRETIEILTSGHISQRRRREGTEAANLGAAVGYLEDHLLPSSQPFDEGKFLELHRILMNDLLARGGDFRIDRRMIAGAKYQPPRAELVQGLTSEMLSELRRLDGAGTDTYHAVGVATWAHWSIARIHPFEDGNGRTARLWQDLVLLRANLAPAIIRLQDRDQNGYYDGLAAADDGDLNPLTQLVAQRTAATLNEYIAAQQQIGTLTDWASRIAGEAATRIAEHRKAQYLRWSTLMEAIRDDFQRCAARVTSSGIEVQFRPYPLIDETAWENIRSGVGAKHTWFFTLSVRKGAQRYAYFFFFGQHFWTDADNESDTSEPRVALLISEQIDRGEATILYKQDDNPVELRELFTNGNAIVAACQPVDGQIHYNRDCKPMQLAMEFIEHVLLRRLT